MFRAIARLLLVSTVAGCGSIDLSAKPGGDGGTSTVAAADMPCDVDDALTTHCRFCHGATPTYGAPMPLVTRADFLAPSVSDPSRKVHERVSARIHDGVRPMPPSPRPSLPPSGVTALETWFAAGLPAAWNACGSASKVPATKPLSCTPDQKVRPVTAIALAPGKTDTYQCYGFDVTAATKRHVIAGAPFIDDARIVHHIILFQVDDPVPSTPTECAGAGGNARFIAGWAPGGGPFELPLEAGFPQDVGTTHYMLQIHYNNPQNLANVVDASGFDLCTTDVLRPYDADVMASGSIAIDIPPRATRETTCDFAWPEALGNVHVFHASPHMHRLGRQERAIRIRGGAETAILDAPTFDFSTGGGGSDASVDLAPGDVVKTTCRWENTTDAAVRFGENTSDEMCFNFMAYYPKIVAPGFRWVVPAAQPSLSGKCVDK